MKHFIYALLFLLISTKTVIATTYVTSRPLPGAHLQASIRMTPSSTPSEPDTSNKVQPGSTIKLSVLIKNVGDKSNHSGDVFIRFAFLKPLEGESRSVLFETEKKHLPSIEAGKEVEITFSKTHQWPSIFDYVRDDWHMRQYEALIDIKGKQEIIGRAAISVSAMYYRGPTNEILAEVVQK